MSATSNHLHRHSPSHERGFALIVCLIMLLVMSLLSVGMYRSANLQERIAGNTREKQRALEAAQSALRYAEWWLKDGSGLGTGTGVACAGMSTVKSPSDMKVCTDPVAEPEKLPWAAYAEYTPLHMSAGGKGGVISASKDIEYYKPPALHVHYMGAAPGGRLLYQISAVGYGGSATAVAVLQSIYEFSSGKTTTALDTP